MRRSSPGGGATSGATCVVVVHPVGNKNEITSKLRRESRKRAYERQKQFNERSVGQMSFHFLTIVVAVAIMVVTFAISEMMIVTTSELQGKSGASELQGKSGGDKHKPKCGSSSASPVVEEEAAAGDHHYYGQVNATPGGAATSLPTMTRTSTRTKTSPDGRMVTTTITAARQMPSPGSDRVCNSDSPPFAAGQQRPGQYPKTVTVTSRQVHQSRHQQGQCSVQQPPPQQQCPAPHQQRASSTSNQCAAAPNQPQHQAATTATASSPYNSDVYRKAKEEAKRIMLENPEKMKEVSEQLLKVTSAALQTLEQLKTTLATAAKVANNSGGGRSKLFATPPVAAVSGGGGGGGASSTP